ncbi:hypothetical protein NLM31_27380 [Bradyrhizobium sp. CCGUVB4N]|uniref:hypothetical protein n=1 Tax=Bradyrhizobium sp. CCGUVB4N TaxID=2949631 RepID=UPI0020B44418|nr:hypothetical protein [Bradyrhizobium sp. CCGUVB4N]MCP3384096.1 hypothetical protein [Bradyrhizobium sp. CCGUVB4N]
MAILTNEEDLAVQAKLNFILGAKTYDTYFQGFHCSELSDGIAIAYAKSEYMAGVISAEFSGEIAVAVESIVGERVTAVLVLPPPTLRR